ncbi:CBS domain-containing protein [Clostridium sp. DJ247]|uniref:CBS domain-containing protein n=1 Tax=Clostridium sp. DJ247 TaxID=2726188 RepID=UPI0037BF11E6
MENNVISIKDDDTIINVLEIMNKENIGYVPVTDKDLNLVGLITRSSLLSVLSNQFIDREVTI